MTHPGSVRRLVGCEAVRRNSCAGRGGRDCEGGPQAPATRDDVLERSQRCLPLGERQCSARTQMPSPKCRVRLPLRALTRRRGSGFRSRFQLRSSRTTPFRAPIGQARLTDPSRRIRATPSPASAGGFALGQSRVPTPDTTFHGDEEIGAPSSPTPGTPSSVSTGWVARTQPLVFVPQPTGPVSSGSPRIESTRELARGRRARSRAPIFGELADRRVVRRASLARDEGLLSTTLKKRFTGRDPRPRVSSRSVAGRGRGATNPVHGHRPLRSVRRVGGRR